MLGMAGMLQAQDPPPETGSATPADGNIPELEAVRVTARRPDTEVVDLYRFRNPVQVEETRFDRTWQEPPSLEDIGMQGGVIPLAVGYVAQKAVQGAERLPGWKQQVRPATARPPPLDPAQMQRALSLCDDQDAACAGTPPDE